MPNFIFKKFSTKINIPCYFLFTTIKQRTDVNDKSKECLLFYFCLIEFSTNLLTFFIKSESL